MISIEKYNETTDFVIPLHRYHYMVRTVIEAIESFYSPRTIYIITPKIHCEEIKKNESRKKKSNIIVIEEETFFEKNYQIEYKTIKNEFNKTNDENHREFGWWYQQLIKLGAFKQINNLSDPYIVWDSDLIPIKKWDIYPTKEDPHFKFAILQEKAKNEWIIEQYKKSLYKLTHHNLCDPEESSGTFVPHHFIFHHRVLEDLMIHIEDISKKSWITSIMQLSQHFFRFSEYRTVASFMKNHYPELLHYHEYKEYGISGERIREPYNFLREMEVFLHLNKQEQQEVSYEDFIRFVKHKYDKQIPSYLQIEHI